MKYSFNIGKVVEIMKFIKNYFIQLKLLFIGFWKNDINLIKKSKISIISIFLLTGIIGIMRHSLEIFGGCDFGYWWDFGSISNTITFSYLLVFFAIPLIVLFFGEFNSYYLKNALKLSIPFLFFIFIIVPFFNSVFNYNWTKLPTIIWPSFFPTFMYVPVGSFVGFAFILYKGTKIFAKLFNSTFFKSFIKVFITLLILYAHTYMIGLAFAWGPHLQIYHMARYINRTNDWPKIQFYSSTFTITLMIFLPFLYSRLKLSKKEKIIFLILFLLSIIFTFIYLNNAMGLIPSLVF